MVSGSSPVSSSTNAYTRYTGYSINSVGCFSDSRYTTFSPSGSSTNRIITCTAARSGFLHRASTRQARPSSRQTAVANRMPRLFQTSYPSRVVNTCLYAPGRRAR